MAARDCGQSSLRMCVMNEAITYGPESYVSSFKKRIIWFRREADKYMWLNRCTRITLIILGATLPVVLNLSTAWWWRDVLATSMSLIITVLVALEGQFRFGERWRHHRMAELTLLAIRRRYVHRASTATVSDRHKAYLDFFEEAERFLESEAQTFWRNLDDRQKQSV